MTDLKSYHVPDLVTLIHSRKGNRAYEKLSTDCGGQPTSKRLQQMATQPLKTFPEVLTIVGLARGLHSTVTEVLLAAARSLNLDVYSGIDPRALVVGGAADLEIDQLDALNAIVSSFLKSNERGPDLRCPATAATRA